MQYILSIMYVYTYFVRKCTYQLLQVREVHKHTYTYIYIYIHEYTAVYIHIIVYTCNVYIHIHTYTDMGCEKMMKGCLPIFLQMKGGGGDHALTPTASDIRVPLQSCRLADSELADLTRKWHGPA